MDFAMPNRSFDEIFDVNHELELGLSESVLLDRFEKYGPIASIVLEPDAKVFDRQKVKVENGLNTKQLAPYFEISLEKITGSRSRSTSFPT
jgi:hypothetical protein